MTSTTNIYSTIAINTNNEIRYIGSGHNFKVFNIDQSLNTSLSNIINNSSYYTGLSISNTGNIGIGSSNPRYQLDVPYNARIENIVGNGISITNINPLNITSGIIDPNILPSSGITSGTYGSSSSILYLDKDIYGRINYCFEYGIQVGTNQVLGLVSSATIDTTNAVNITNGKIDVSRLDLNNLKLVGNANKISNINASNINKGILNSYIYPIVSTITSGQYGSPITSQILSVDNYGRIVSITNTILVNNNLSTISNATNYTSGIISSSVLNTDDIISSGTYNSGLNTLTILVDSYGRTLSISNNSININASKISGLSSSATIDTTDATNISNGISMGNIITLNSINAKYIGLSLGITNINVKNLSTISSFHFSSSGVINSLTNITNIKLSSISVDKYGRISHVDELSLDASNAVTTGKFSTNRLPTISNVSGTYGSTINSLSLSIDLYGRITSITNVPLSISYNTISGLPSSSTLNVSNITNIGTNISNNLYLGNNNQNITIYGSSIVFNNVNNIYNKYNNNDYNFPIYYKNTFINQKSIIIPIKYSKNTNIYNSCEIKIYFTIDNTSSGGPWNINFTSTKSSMIDTTNIVSVVNNEEQYISTGQNGDNPILSYSNSLTLISNIGNYGTTIIKNINNTLSGNYINLTINGLDNITSVYSVESVYNKDNINNITRSYGSGMFINNNAKFLYIEIDNVLASISGYYSVINYY